MNERIEEKTPLLTGEVEEAVKGELKNAWLDFLKLPSKYHEGIFVGLEIALERMGVTDEELKKIKDNAKAEKRENS